MGDGGGWENEIRADFKVERQIRLQFQGKVIVRGSRFGAMGSRGEFTAASWRAIGS